MFVFLNLSEYLGFSFTPPSSGSESEETSLLAACAALALGPSNLAFFVSVLPLLLGVAFLFLSAVTGFAAMLLC